MIRAPRTLALLPASLLLASSLWGQKSEGRFWNWFQAHDSALFAVKTGSEPICGELSEELHRVHPALTFEFGPVDSGRREFVLSADGIRDAFPAVLALGRTAPALAHWTITQFRPPRPDVTQISVGGLQLDARTVQFLAELDGDRTGLTVSVPGYKATPNKPMSRRPTCSSTACLESTRSRRPLASSRSFPPTADARVSGGRLHRSVKQSKHVPPIDRAT